ncbi:MAG TPA: VCBS domain-containing protein, partial [Allocoleopsis sp.]
GQLQVNSDGTFSFNPGTGYNNLKAGGSVPESFTYTVSDGNGGTNTATVTLNIAGANDVAVIGGTATATVTEDATNPNLTATGTLTVTDPDAGENQFSTTVTGTNGNLGSLSINSSGAYTYSVANSAVQSLGAKQTKTETFTVQTVDGTTQNVTINIAGVNDAPTVGTGTTTGSVKKSSDKPTGSFNFSDVDLQDSHTLTVTPAGNGYVGNLTPSITNPATGDGAGIVTWSFAVSDSDLAALKDNRNQSYTIRINDGQGGSVAQTVTIALQGSEDGPVGTPIGKKGITKNGGNRNDRLTGSNDDDVLNGKGGNDRLVGKAGNDKINGGSGNDIINGGAGADQLVGGPGNDTFQISPLSSSLLSGFDRIQNLVIGQDRIDGPKAVPASKVAKLGNVSSFNEAGIQAVLTTGAFKSNG